MRIAIADTHKLIREALVARLSSEGGVEVVGHTECDARMLQIVADEQPDILLADLELANPTKSDIFRILQDTAPSMRTCIWSSTPVTSVAFTVMGLGAHGFLPKQFSGDQVVCALTSIACGYSVIPTEYLANFSLLRRNVTRHGNIFGLSPREIDVLESCAAGLTIRETAEKLGISVRTVETHRSAIYRKTDCDCMADIGGIVNSPGQMLPHGHAAAAAAVSHA